MNAAAVGKFLKAIPPVAYLAAGGVLLIYLATRKLFGGGAAGVGEAIGRGVAGVVSGTAVGAATAAGTVAGTTAAAVIKLPGQVIDTTLLELTGDPNISLRRLGEKLGEGLFNLFNTPYDPNVPNTPAQRRASVATSPVRPEDKVSTYGTIN